MRTPLSILTYLIDLAKQVFQHLLRSIPQQLAANSAQLLPTTPAKADLIFLESAVISSVTPIFEINWF